MIIVRFHLMFQSSTPEHSIYVQIECTTLYSRDCYIYRQQVYNLTCVANNGLSEKTTTLLQPVLNYTCQIGLEISARHAEHSAVLRPESHWYRSETIILVGIVKERKCKQVSVRTLSLCHFCHSRIFQTRIWCCRI